MSTLIIAAAQLNFKVGDIEGNAQKVIEVAQKTTVDLIVFPELSLSGYPPEDLLFRPALFERIHRSLDTIKQSTLSCALIVGYPEQQDGHCYNAAALIQEGTISSPYYKQKLPNYGVFDEQRYFKAGSHAGLIHIKGIRIAVLICEDLWQAGPIEQAMAQGAQLIVSLNASPFTLHQAKRREEMLKKQSAQFHIPILYANLVGAQDELVFDGGSMAVDAQAQICQQAPYFQESLMLSHFDSDTASFKKEILPAPLAREESLYQALVLGLKDYVHKNGFKQVLLGLSGGIDSALSLAIAVDALGAENVQGVMMPSRYTADISLEDAIAEAEALKVSYQIISIEESYQAFLNTLSDSFSGTKADTTEQNIQARCRAIILMALSNKFGSLVLTTSNKSEMAVGYSTLYGDMAGAFCVLKDVLKTDVYRLAHYRNSIKAVIPKRVLERAPTAELAENQSDQDSLPPYEILDEIIQRYVEQNQDAASIIAAGFEATLVNDMIQKIKRNEYKRRQAPVGVRLTERAFGRDRRYPISSGY